MGSITGNFTSGMSLAGTASAGRIEGGRVGGAWFGRAWVRQLAVVAAALLFVAVGEREAQAQCSQGTYIGSCTDGLGYEGCCNGQRVTWCEGTARCEINCAENFDAPQNSCCSQSASPGCCDNTVMECVCAIDDFCCGAPDPFFGDPGFWDDLCVDYAVIDCGGCGSCNGPATQCGWQNGDGYYNCASTASADPTGANPRMCGGGCTPQCSGRQCGADGCGGVCGQCLSGQSCNTSSGQCISSCTPQCNGRQCGADGCGGVCGQCLSGQSCNTTSGQCISSCTPQCSGRQCGPDGCGGVCGQCLSGQSCNTTTGQCAASCTPQCSGRQCGTDGCGGVCGQCLSGQSCNAQGQCAAQCVPSCSGKACGDDGCGGSCGTCPNGQSCSTGACVSECTPSCAGKVCGDDGCGGSCGTCSTGEACDEAGACVSSCGCEGKQCGDDGCGRVCGYCGPNTVCNAETNQCDARPVTTPDNDQPGPQPETCPTGQIWSAYAGACVLDPTQGGNAGSSSSGCGGGPMSGLAIFGFGLLLARRFRSR